MLSRMDILRLVFGMCLFGILWAVLSESVYPVFKSPIHHPSHSQHKSHLREHSVSRPVFRMSGLQTDSNNDMLPLEDKKPRHESPAKDIQHQSKPLENQTEVTPALNNTKVTPNNTTHANTTTIDSNNNNTKTNTTLADENNSEIIHSDNNSENASLAKNSLEKGEHKENTHTQTELPSKEHLQARNKRSIPAS
eukprot:TRINITY_DN971_c0_g1_i2.p1 TRINITY_DN971_c0_g1~~TRINITY_DN971_c0_g1_i2.p1  ORF type:complete len:194 (+),score=42.71 TRINITY_DN971_c0_g1_i2:127-708(+)